MPDDHGPGVVFPAFLNGATVNVTALAYSDQISLVADGLLLEIPLAVFERLTIKAIVAAHSRPS